jgi:hypothetical protein
VNLEEIPISHIKKTFEEMLEEQLAVGGASNAIEEKDST